MSRILLRTVLLTALVGLIIGAASAQAIQQQLVLVQNDKTVGGVFQVAIQIKGTGLTAANTLASATIDVIYDNTKLTFVNGSSWSVSAGLGYTRSATNNTTAIRVGVLGTTVNGNDDGTPEGVDITASYVTLVQLNFTIASGDGTTSLTIDDVTNAVGLFENHSNDPKTGGIVNMTLSAPINIVGEALPVQLATFAVTPAQSNGSVLVKWSTASETNNYGFEVQKAPDTSNAFQTIPNSFVAGHGTTVEAHAYAFTDATVQSGLWYYRLKQTDLDGTIHYSEKISASSVTGVKDRPLPTAFALDQNYPNPFNPSTTIEFALPKDAHVSLDIYNVIGQRVATLVDEVRQAGYHSVKFDAGKLASGLYIYRIAAGEVTMVKKMMLTK